MPHEAGQMYGVIVAVSTPCGTIARPRPSSSLNRAGASFRPQRDVHELAHGPLSDGCYSVQSLMRLQESRPDDVPPRENEPLPFPAPLNLGQAFLDRTGDLATVALVSARCCHHMPSALWKPERTKVWQWLEVYRSTLDRWRMWVPR